MTIEIWLIWRERLSDNVSGLHSCDTYRDKKIADEAVRELQSFDPRFKFIAIPARLHD